MRQNLVSVLMPAYNHENYVQDTIKSVIDQTYQNIELIVVDDGSKDSTWQKIQDMRDICKKRFSRVHFETKSNEGTCKTLNRLLDLAQGEYIYMISSDDQIKSHAVEKELNFLKDNPDYALVVGDDEFINSQGIRIYLTQDNTQVTDEQNADYKTLVEYLSATHQTSIFQSDNFGSYTSLCRGNYVPNGFLIRKSIFDKVGKYTPEAPLEDWFLMLQISKYAKLKYLDEVLFSYRLHGNNTINNSERMLAMRNKTRQYEATVLEKVDPKEVLPEVMNVKKCGALYKRKNILQFIEISKYIKGNCKITVVKLFGITVFRYTKKA